MPKLSREDFAKEFAQCTKFESDIDLPKDILNGRESLLFALNELTDYKLTVSELNQTFLALCGILLGKYPKIAWTVQKNDRIRLPFAAIEQLPASKGKLDNLEKLIFAFCAFYSVCMIFYDEKTNTKYSGIKYLNSSEQILKRLQWAKNKYPEKFSFLESEQEPPEPFGFSINNPVKTVSVGGEYAYLNNLRTQEIDFVQYERIGSMAGKDGGIIDGYKLFFRDGGIVKTATIYIDPYSTENSNRAPEGFILITEGSQDLEKLAKLANNGDIDAQFKIGIAYNDSNNYSEAMKYYKMAAAQEHPGAMTNIGLFYSQGRGVPQSYEKAAEWYSKAAKNYPDALHNLGVLYSRGHGVEFDPIQAINLWVKAAERGNILSQGNLGNEYYNGILIPQDFQEAAKWYTMAANQGDMFAQHNLAVM